MTGQKYFLNPIGFVISPIKDRMDAPSQGYEGSPDVWIELDKNFMDGLDGVSAGQELIIITWLHKSKRDILKLHPRWDKNNPLTGVFSTRSPDRPNPIGLHRVKVLEIKLNKIKVGPLEVIDDTPVIDIKPILNNSTDY